MNAAMGQSIEFAGWHAPHGNPFAVGRLNRVDDASSRAVADAQFLHAPGAKGLEDRVDTVDQHAERLTRLYRRSTPGPQRMRPRVRDIRQSGERPNRAVTPLRDRSPARADRVPDPRRDR